MINCHKFYKPDCGTRAKLHCFWKVLERAALSEIYDTTYDTNITQPISNHYKGILETRDALRGASSLPAFLLVFGECLRSTVQQMIPMDCGLNERHCAVQILEIYERVLR